MVCNWAQNRVQNIFWNNGSPFIRLYMKKRKSKKSEISMQNNELFEGRKKRETGDQARLGEYSRSWFWEFTWDWGLELGLWSLLVDSRSELGCTQNFNREPGPGKWKDRSPPRWARWPRFYRRTGRAAGPERTSPPDSPLPYPLSSAPCGLQRQCA